MKTEMLPDLAKTLSSLHTLLKIIIETNKRDCNGAVVDGRKKKTLS